MKTPETIPPIIIENIRKSFPHNADDILRDIKFDNIGGYYFFHFSGMYVGVELDGYIHT